MFLHDFLHQIPQLPADIGDIPGDGAAQQLGLDDDVQGEVITSLDGNGRAADAGLSVSDVILQVGDTAVTSPHDVDKAINSSKSNAVLLQIERHGARIFVGIKLA